MKPEYVCRRCGLVLEQVGTKIFRHAVVSNPLHSRRFPPQTCGTKPMPIKAGDYAALVNRKASVKSRRKPIKRTIDIEQFSDTLLHFWAVQKSMGKSYRELGNAYGMNGLQMRSAIAAWKRKNHV